MAEDYEEKYAQAPLLKAFKCKIPVRLRRFSCIVPLDPSACHFSDIGKDTNFLNKLAGP